MADDVTYQVAGNKSNRNINTVFIIEGIFIIIILLDLIYLNIAFVLNSKSSQSATATIANIPAQNQPQIFEESTPTPIFSTKPTPTFTPTPSPRPTTATTTQSSTIKDYFIPLGSGTSQAGDWTDVTGAQATVDFGQYQNIKSITLEVSLSVPTGNQTVYVRLYNVTDKHPVWFSDVTMSGGTSAYLTSSPVTYDTGEKTYQVQMKTQLQYTANLTQARIHIILN